MSNLFQLNDESLVIYCFEGIFFHRIGLGVLQETFVVEKVRESLAIGRAMPGFAIFFVKIFPVFVIKRHMQQTSIFLFSLSSSRR